MVLSVLVLFESFGNWKNKAWYVTTYHALFFQLPKLSLAFYFLFVTYNILFGITNVANLLFHLHSYFQNSPEILWRRDIFTKPLLIRM